MLKFYLKRMYFLLFELAKFYFEAINKYTKVQYTVICDEDIFKSWLKLRIVKHPWSPSIWGERKEDQNSGQPQLYAEFGTSLSYRRPCLKEPEQQQKLQQTVRLSRLWGNRK